MANKLVYVAWFALHRGIAVRAVEETMKKYQCIVCGYIYDEAEGCEVDGIPPGTTWDDVPDDWVCPECGVAKEDFEMVEVD